MIDVKDLSKRYGDTIAVDGLTFSVRPGIVTGFLGPNGSGKSTTMRLIMGLDRPTTGSAEVGGGPLVAHKAPMHAVGALLETKQYHAGRSAYTHLHALAASNVVPKSRVHEVAEMVGLHTVLHKRVKGFSLGMGQRLGLATALLADPEVLILDEPVNGLDPEGMRWFRELMKSLASEGRTVFISSHLLSEMSLTADWLIVIARGRLLADVSTEEFVERSTRGYVSVRSPDVSKLEGYLNTAGATCVDQHDGSLEVTGLSRDRIGDLAAEHHMTLHELASKSASLEDAFIEATEGEAQFTGQGGDE